MQSALHNLSVLGVVRQGIAFLINLLKSFLSCFVHLQFKDIGSRRHQHHHINPASMTLHLSLGIHIEHIKDKVEGVFVESLDICHLLKFLLESFHVRETSQECLHLTKSQFQVVILQCTPELQGEAFACFTYVHADVCREQALCVAYLNLLIGYIKGLMPSYIGLRDSDVQMGFALKF